MDTLRSKMLNGDIGAITIDTCIFTGAGYRLDKGELKLLEQFKNNPISLIFSDITIEELKNHISSDGELASIKLVSALREAGKYWSLDKKMQQDVYSEICGNTNSGERASERVEEFIKRCGATILKSDEYLDVASLLNLYFKTEAPFESSKDKKAEFPDAIALLSLESWGKKNSTSIIFITKDKGCKAFCEKSKTIHVVSELSEALSLIQDRDNHIDKLCQDINEKITNGDYPGIHNSIRKTAIEDAMILDWTAEAESFGYYDYDIAEIQVLDARFKGRNNPNLFGLDYRNGTLTAKAEIEITISATCHFVFYTKDGIDRDMVRIGDAVKNKRFNLPISILFEFHIPHETMPEIIDMQLVYASRNLDFGRVDPDYSSEYD